VAVDHLRLALESIAPDHLTDEELRSWVDERMAHDTILPGPTNQEIEDTQRLINKLRLQAELQQRIDEALQRSGEANTSPPEPVQVSEELQSQS